MTAALLQGLPGTRKTTINSDWAEPWTEAPTAASTDDIAAFARPVSTYRLKTLDRPVRWLLLFFDQQGNHRDDLSYPWVLRGMEPGSESWLIDCGWAKNQAERDEIERTSWTIGGKPRTADHVIGDSANGKVSFEQYLWAAGAPARRILLRGDPSLDDGIPWKEVVDAPGTRRRTPKPAGVREWRVHPHHWRTILWERITRRRQPGWWMPEDAPPFYQRSLTSEEQVIEPRQRPGRGRVEVVVWKPRVISSTNDSVNERKDNHWWDAEAGICAAASILRLDQVAVRTRPAALGTGAAAGGWMAGYSV